jgi:hypothetical protein
MTIHCDDPDVMRLECKTFDEGCRRIIHDQLRVLYKLAKRQEKRSSETAKYHKDCDEGHQEDVVLLDFLKTLMTITHVSQKDYEETKSDRSISDRDNEILRLHRKCDALERKLFNEASMFVPWVDPGPAGMDLNNYADPPFRYCPPGGCADPAACGQSMACFRTDGGDRVDAKRRGTFHDEPLCIRQR